MQSRCATHQPVKTTLSHPSLYARLLNTFVQVCKTSEDPKYIASITRIVATCVSDSTPALCRLIVQTKVDHLLVHLLTRSIPDLVTKQSAPGHREAVQIAGNACKCLIAIVKEPCGFIHFIRESLAVHYLLRNPLISFIFFTFSYILSL